MQQYRGQTSYHAGLAAEAIVAREYERRSHTVADRRWRGAAGEIDLVARDGDTVVFVEVKKSRTLSGAAQRISRRQVARIHDAAQEFLSQEPRGQLTDVRFDLALVDGQGQVKLLENAFMMH